MAKSPNWSKDNLPPNLDPAIIAYLKTLKPTDWKVLNKVRHDIEDLNPDQDAERTAKAQVV